MLLAGFVFWLSDASWFSVVFGPCWTHIGPKFHVRGFMYAVDIPAWSSTVMLDTHRIITIPQLFPTSLLLGMDGQRALIRYPHTPCAGSNPGHATDNTWSSAGRLRSDVLLLPRCRAISQTWNAGAKPGADTA